MAARFFLTAGLLALAFAGAAQSIRLDFYADVASAAAARPGLQTKGRSLVQDNTDTVCYEGCMLPPQDDPSAPPLPTLLFSAPQPASLLDCYEAAVQANLPYFAIGNVTSCYGGDAAVMGWALDEGCPLECVPGSPEPSGVCGGINKASVFSMGACLRLDVPCEPGIPPPAPPSPPTNPAPPRAPSSPVPPRTPASPPPSPPPRRPPPSPVETPGFPDPPAEPNFFDAPPPPSPPSSAFTCRDATSLWCDELTKIKLSVKATTAANIATCRAHCLAEPLCKGFYYKTTSWCYLASHVYGYKAYGTSVIACKATLSG